MSVGVGATVITKDKFEQLTPEQQKVLREVGDASIRVTLIARIRKDNERAVEALQKKAGLQIVEFEDDAREAWDVIAMQKRIKHSSVKFTHKTFLDKINALLEEYRKKQVGSRLR